MKRNITILIIFLIVLAAVLGAYAYNKNNTQIIDKDTDTTEAPSGRAMSIEQYVSQNISELSPEKEVLGGTFYVTKIEANAGTGTVEYEDGHNAFVADFTYDIDPEHGAITIKSFIVRK
jgi:hypothetical protein